ncbi:hypothetical protein [Streptomyces hygroscopicus]|uniref:hypothetical protein n=1 Tax=Streptomyces hygroscopicus TaxID=1912 RepID=UPI0036D04118
MTVVTPLRTEGSAAWTAKTVQTTTAAREVSTTTRARRWLVERSSRQIPVRATPRQIAAAQTALPAVRATIVGTPSPHWDNRSETQAG